jgi:hypothetical protein
MMNAQENALLWIHWSAEKWVLGFSQEEFLNILKMQSLDSIKYVLLEGQGAQAITTRGLLSLRGTVQICLQRGWKPSVWVSDPLRTLLEKIGFSRLVLLQKSSKVSEDAFFSVSDLEKDWLWESPTSKELHS